MITKLSHESEAAYQAVICYAYGFGDLVSRHTVGLHYHQIKRRLQELGMFNDDIANDMQVKYDCAMDTL